MSLDNTITLEELPPTSSPPPTLQPEPPDQADTIDHPDTQSEFPQEAQEAQRDWKICMYWVPTKPRKRYVTVLGLVLGFISLIAAIIGLGPGFKGAQYGEKSVQLSQKALDLEAWQAKVSFREWCQDEKDAGRLLSPDCETILLSALPPPPYMRRFEDPHTRNEIDRSPNLLLLRLLLSLIILLVVNLFYRRGRSRFFKTTARHFSRFRRHRSSLPTFLQRDFTSFWLHHMFEQPRRVSRAPPRTRRASASFDVAEASAIDFALRSDDSALKRRNVRLPRKRHSPRSNHKTTLGKPTLPKRPTRPSKSPEMVPELPFSFEKDPDLNTVAASIPLQFKVPAIGSLNESYERKTKTMNGPAFTPLGSPLVNSIKPAFRVPDFNKASKDDFRTFTFSALCEPENFSTTAMSVKVQCSTMPGTIRVKDQTSSCNKVGNMDWDEFVFADRGVQWKYSQEVIADPLRDLLVRKRKRPAGTK